MRLRLQNKIKFNHPNARPGTWKLYRFVLKTGRSSAGDGITGERFRHLDVSDDDNMLLLLPCCPARKANAK